MDTIFHLEDQTGWWAFEDGSVILWGVEPMSYNLFDLTLAVARELGWLKEGKATGGNTTTLNDTNDRTEDNDYWNGGTVWIIKDAAGLGAAPEGEYSAVTDSTSAGAITLLDTLSAAIAVGDRYAIADKKYPLQSIISKINAALLDLGVVPVTDVTTVTIATDQTEYTLPIAASLDLRQVWYQTVDDDTNDNRWVEILNWEVEKSAAGVADKLIVPLQLDTGYKLKLVYMAPHNELYTYTDPLSDHIPAERVIYAAVLECLKQKKQRTNWNDFDADIARYTQKSEQVKQTRPIIVPRRPGKIITPGLSLPVPDNEPNKVYLR